MRRDSTLACCMRDSTRVGPGRPIQPASAACNARGCVRAASLDAAPGMHTITIATRAAGAGARVHRRAALLNDAMTAAPVAGHWRHHASTIASTSGRAVTVVVITAHVRHWRAHPGRHARRRDRRPRPRRQLPGQLGRAPSAGLVREGGAPCTRTRPRIAAQVHTYMQISGSRCLHYHSKNA